MRALIQRVKQASVAVNNSVVGEIEEGVLILLGVSEDDSKADAEWLAKKVAQLRIFNDLNGMMNLSLQEINGQALVVSQFTLHAATKKGNRPSFIKAARPEQAIPLYQYFVAQLQLYLEKDVKTGQFGAHMEVKLLNDGPVTIWIDTLQKE